MLDADAAWSIYVKKTSFAQRGEGKNERKSGKSARNEGEGCLLASGSS